MICSAVYRSKRAHIGVDTPVLEAGRMTIDPTAQIRQIRQLECSTRWTGDPKVLFG
jgi:hypothetical protein